MAPSGLATAGPPVSVVGGPGVGCDDVGRPGVVAADVGASEVDLGEVGPPDVVRNVEAVDEAPPAPFEGTVIAWVDGVLDEVRTVADGPGNACPATTEPQAATTPDRATRLTRTRTDDRIHRR